MNERRTIGAVVAVTAIMVFAGVSPAAVVVYDDCEGAGPVNNGSLWEAVDVGNNPTDIVAYQSGAMFTHANKYVASADQYDPESHGWVRFSGIYTNTRDEGDPRVRIGTRHSGVQTAGDGWRRGMWAEVRFHDDGLEPWVELSSSSLANNAGELSAKVCQL